ncbi:MAG: hypothetical protein A2Y77_18410 [Planctomycetes bacterium RBG_13_62_9]|nr:MAG: hypothetical protein A2Y77_18410 [Planctomycetes bacterium RBG_13_62_9]
MKKLNQQEKRMVVIGAVLIVAIPVFTYGTTGMGRWSKSRSDLAAARQKLAGLETDETRQAGLIALVPVFEDPQPEEKQKFLFRDKLHEQLKKAGINTEPLQFVPGKKTTVAGVAYKALRIKCRGKCKFEQMLDFLANLKENPYLIGVEELRIQCDAKEPAEKRKDKEVQIDLVVSTFVRDAPERPAGANLSKNADQNSR